MKVVLTKDAPGIGKKHQIKAVKRGFFMNFLLPRGLAIYGNPGRVKEAEKINRQMKDKLQFESSHAQELKEKIASTTLTFTKKVSAQNRLFGSITEKDIVQSLKEQGVEIQKDHLRMKNHIKTVGEHLVMIQLRDGVEAELKVKVEDEAGK